MEQRYFQYILAIAHLMWNITPGLSVPVARDALGAGEGADVVDPSGADAVGPEVRVEARGVAGLDEDLDGAGVEGRAVGLGHEGVERRVRRRREQRDDVLVRDDVHVGAVLVGKRRQVGGGGGDRQLREGGGGACSYRGRLCIGGGGGACGNEGGGGE
ncbi:hypothetical protein PG999_010430 [Apiospora kogelbergensis]|uniref:Uncharacterized protein n=1 Tax=Apiospora kogelbergensis TaxID=1337665 RepID=A0AAW0QKZ5_9PEZI